MSKFIIFNKLTGEIQKEVTCQAGDLDLNYNQETESWIIHDDNIVYPAHVDVVTLAVVSDNKTEYELWVEADYAAKGTRSELLLRSDWTQLPDVPLATKEAWAVYRQALRDVTSQVGYPFSIDWPSEPT